MPRRQKDEPQQSGPGTPPGDGDGLQPAGPFARNSPLAAMPDSDDGSPEAAAINLFATFASQLSPLRDDHPADVEFLACELVGLVNLIADDDPMPGGETGLRPSELLGEGPPGAADEMLTTVAFALTESQRLAPDARYVDCIRPCLPFCTEEARPELEVRVAQLEAKVGRPDWADAVWNATASGGWHSYDDLGDLSCVGVELHWPSGWPDQVLFGSIAVEDGPFAVEFIVTPMDEYRSWFTPGTPWPADPDEPACRTDVIRHIEPMPVEEVVGRLLEAMAMTEMLEDRPIADDYFVYAPLAQQTLAGLPSIEPPEPTPANDEVQEAMIRDFLNADGVAAAIGFEGDPGFAHDVGEFCELFIHYSERFAGGDRYRWSPMVVEGFLLRFGDVATENLEADEFLNPVLSEWVKFCHRHKGWPASVTAECLATIDAHDHDYDDHDHPSPGDLDLVPPPRRDGLERMAVEIGTDPSDPDSM
ncbi:hypothetical protein [Candidatus Microthrix parvicella]|uniref:Uncharacterized protein n=1 Tax=Candidatus Neomicrothrix parvicella RN1 TaxID=1229780 RepID=R4Z694_9ACTN|nr:hypothetical protein [Candidatus Microthrix parvicella]CCM64322.1 hypothetical protein BN381_360024 [Candidatus Microthrix parvicella RN1]